MPSRLTGRSRRSPILVEHRIGGLVLARGLAARRMLAPARAGSTVAPRLPGSSLNGRNSIGRVVLDGQARAGLFKDAQRALRAVCRGLLHRVRASLGREVRGQATSIQVPETVPIARTARVPGVDRVREVEVRARVRVQLERLHGSRDRASEEAANHRPGADQSRHLAPNRAGSPNPATRASLELAGPGLRTRGRAARGRVAGAATVLHEGKSGVSCPAYVDSRSSYRSHLRECSGVTYKLKPQCSSGKGGFRTTSQLALLLWGNYYATRRLLNGK